MTGAKIAIPAVPHAKPFESSSIKKAEPKKNDDYHISKMVSGAAIFDLNGIPKEYFTTAGNSDISWIQAIAQVFGLQSLLISSLQLDGFHHAAIYGLDHCAILIKQHMCYVALLVKRENSLKFFNSFIPTMQEFEPGCLKANPHFKNVNLS